MNHFNDHLLFSNNIWDNAHYLKALQEAQLNEVRASKGVRSKDPEVKERAIARQKAKKSAHNRMSAEDNKEYYRLVYSNNPKEAKKYAARAYMHDDLAIRHIENIDRIRHGDTEEQGN